MNEDLEKLHELVHDSITPRKLNAPDAEKHKEIAIRHTRSLRNNFILNSIRATSRKALSLSVHVAQNTVSILLNRLYRYHQRHTSEFYDFLMRDMSQFLKFLRKNFKSHFDLDKALPMPLWLPIREELEKKLSPETAGNELLSELVTLVRTQLNDMAAEHPLSYREADYWDLLTRHLYDPVNDSQDPVVVTIYRLIAHNFNSPALIEFVIQLYALGVKEETDPVIHWNRNLYHVQGVREQIEEALFPPKTSCKKMLLEDIRREIRTAEFAAIAPELMGISRPFQFASVPLLALFFRLQKDANLLQVDNITELFKHICFFYRTAHSQVISPEKLRNKFYSHNHTSISAMKDYLISMINLLKNYEQSIS